MALPRNFACHKGVEDVRGHRENRGKHPNSHEIMGMPLGRSCLVGFSKDDLELNRERRDVKEMLWKRWMEEHFRKLSTLSFLPSI